MTFQPNKHMPEPPKLRRDDDFGSVSDWLGQLWHQTWKVWFPKQRQHGAGLSYDTEDRLQVDPAVPTLHSGVVALTWTSAPEVTTVTAPWVQKATASILLTPGQYGLGNDPAPVYLQAWVQNIIDGVSFDIAIDSSAVAPDGNKYEVAWFATEVPL